MLAAYRSLVRPALLDALPPGLRSDPAPRGRRGAGGTAALVAAALLGVVTHVVWDAFTHRTGWVAARIPVLLQPASALGLDRPWYGVLQHGSTLVGAAALCGAFALLAIGLVHRRRAGVERPPDAPET